MFEILERFSARDIENKLVSIRELISEGYDVKGMAAKLSIPISLAEALYEIGRAQIKYSNKFSKPYLVDTVAARLATHDIVASYHANRLKTRSIADLGCGVGVQLIHFAKESGFAYGVEIDRDKSILARLNAELAGANNIMIINDDAFSDRVKKALSDVDIIFSDPARALYEKERKLSSCKPNPEEIVKAYDAKFAFDLPPQITRDNVALPKPIEFEYISVDMALNRLTVYLGELAERGVSAISLPSNERIVKEENPPQIEHVSPSPGDLVYEVDNTILKAGLLSELAGKLGLRSFLDDGKRVLLAGADVESSFLKKYILIGFARTKKELLRLLAENGFGKVVLRYYTQPEDYYRERGSIESKLKGNRVVHLYKHKEYGYVILQRT